MNRISRWLPKTYETFPLFDLDACSGDILRRRSLVYPNLDVPAGRIVRIDLARNGGLTVYYRDLDLPLVQVSGVCSAVANLRTDDNPAGPVVTMTYPFPDWVLFQYDACGNEIGQYTINDYASLRAVGVHESAERKTG